MRGHRGHAHAGACFETCRFRQLDRQMRGHNGEFRSGPQGALAQTIRRPVHIIEPHALANPRRANAIADGLDHARTIIVHQNLLGDHRPLRARAKFDIRGVHTRGAHGHQNLAGTGGGTLHLLQRQCLARGASAGVYDRLHDLSSHIVFVGFGRMNLQMGRKGKRANRFRLRLASAVNQDLKRPAVISDCASKST